MRKTTNWSVKNVLALAARDGIDAKTTMFQTLSAVSHCFAVLITKSGMVLDGTKFSLHFFPDNDTIAVGYDGEIFETNMSRDMEAAVANNVPDEESNNILPFGFSLVAKDDERWSVYHAGLERVRSKANELRENLDVFNQHAKKHNTLLN